MRLERVTERIEDVAREGVNKIDSIKKRRSKLDKHAFEHRLELVHERVYTKNKLVARMRDANYIVNDLRDRNLQKSLKDY